MTNNAPLGREGILALKSTFKTQAVTVDGSVLHIRSRDAEASMFIGGHLGTSKYVAAIFVSCVVDENGNRVFGLTDDDMAEVMRLPESVVGAVVKAATEMNRPAVEEEIKNSPASPTTDSPTD